FADWREGAGIGRGVTARRAADRRLIDVDDLVEMLQALDLVEGRGRVMRVVQFARDGLVEGVDQERRFPAAGNAGDAGEQPERNFRGDVLEVITARVDDFEFARRVGFFALLYEYIELA